MAYTNFITIQDRASTGSLWEGQEVLVMATSINISSANTITPKPKTNQVTTRTTEDDALGDGVGSYFNNYNRRKSNVSYTGFQNSRLSIKSVFSQEKLGNSTNIGGVEKKIWTPSKLYELILKPRTVYIKDQVLVDLLKTTQDTSPLIYSVWGIPVILSSWNIVPSVEDKEIVMEMEFIEDKEIV